MLSEDLVRLLACPACSERPPLHYEKEASKLMCSQCGRKYPIREDIPILLVEEAELPSK